MYNLTQLSNAENIQDIVVFSNTTTEPITAMGVISVSLFFIMIMVLLKWGFDRAILVSSFMSFILTSLLAWGGMLSMYYPFVFLAMTAFVYLYMVFTTK